MLNGIDVSHYQGAIAWGEVKAGGTDFAYIKATEGTTYTDPMAASNIEGAQACGLLHGVYHFLTVGNVEGQIKLFRSVASTLTPGNLPPVCDAETPGNTVDEVLTFLSAFPGCILYTNPSMIKSWGANVSRLLSHRLWIANYGVTSPAYAPWKEWTFWQYSDTGEIEGIGTQVDLDYFDGTLEELNALCVPSLPT